MAALKQRRIGFRPALWIAFGFGSGFVPKAPGTAGTLAAIPLVVVVSFAPVFLQAVIWAALFALGCWACQIAENWLGEEDPGVIVWDEIVGFGIAMAFLPVSLYTVVVAFLLFRIADIFKPWPISWLEKRLTGGLGIMLDDLLAGVMTNIVIHVLLFVGVMTL